MTNVNPSPGGASADLLLVNGLIATQDDRQSFVNALTIKNGRIHAPGDAATVMAHKGPATRAVELNAAAPETPVFNLIPRTCGAERPY